MSIKYVTQKVDPLRLSYPGRYGTQSFVSQSYVDQTTDPTSTFEAQLNTPQAQRKTTTSNWHTTPIQFEYKFDTVDANNIQVTFTNVTENKIFFTYIINFTQTLLNTFVAQTVYGVATEYHAENNGKTEVVSPGDIVNYSDTTFSTKDEAPHFVGKSIVKFFCTKNNPTINDLIFMVYAPVAPNDPSAPNTYGAQNVDPTWAPHTITVDGTAIDSTSFVKEIASIKDLLYPITTSYTTSGNVITVNVTTNPAITEVYLSSTVGYIAKTVVPITNGTGTFNVVTTGLNSGDVVNVKIGYKYWSNVVTFNTTI
jgi:hypothetical protein